MAVMGAEAAMLHPHTADEEDFLHVAHTEVVIGAAQEDMLLTERFHILGSYSFEYGTQLFYFFIALYTMQHNRISCCQMFDGVSLGGLWLEGFVNKRKICTCIIISMTIESFMFHDGIMICCVLNSYLMFVLGKVKC